MNGFDKLNIKNNRPWGYYVNVACGSGFLTKIIHVNPQGKLSLQSHRHRNEHWFILNGEAHIKINDKNFVLKRGDSIDIPLKTVHTVHNQGKTDLEFVEIQTGELLSEDDIIRYEDIYGRV